MDELPLDYVAGLFDGEGWFQIDRGTGVRMRRGIAADQSKSCVLVVGRLW